MASLALRLIGVVCGRGQALSKVEANRPANARGAFAAPVEISIRWKRSGSGGAFVRGIRRREPNRGNRPKGFGRRRPASGKKNARPPCSALRSPAEAWSGSRRPAAKAKSSYCAIGARFGAARCIQMSLRPFRRGQSQEKQAKRPSPESDKIRVVRTARRLFRTNWGFRQMQL